MRYAAEVLGMTFHEARELGDKALDEVAPRDWEQPKLKLQK